MIAPKASRVVTRIAERQIARCSSEHGRSVTVKAGGRHDPCVLPRAVPMVEAMAALVLADLYLVHRARADMALGPFEEE